ncbi:MAG: sensor histidine kinase [Deltaproteobacteria bacterium]|nr:sensor histidine kinase [Deltaproteobacteria bacterium]
MEIKSVPFKFLTILVLTSLITILHYSTGHGNIVFHILHRELYTIPILLASFWFGLRIGLSVSAIISVIYAAYILLYDVAHGSAITVFSQIIFFNLVAIVLGRVVDLQRKQQAELMHAEKLAVLDRAATALSYEMRDILDSLKRLTAKSVGIHNGESRLGEELQREIVRLEGLLENLSSYVPPEQFETLSKDLNEIIRQRMKHNRGRLKESRISVHTRLDENGCASQVNVEKIGWVIDQLIGNAIELSLPGGSIQIRSERGTSHCRIEVQDQGPGIRPEHMHKVFQPFFTTTGKGTGLSLACSKKILDDMGGDMQVTSEWGKGATFTLTVPREKQLESFRDKVLAKGKPST